MEEFEAGWKLETGDYSRKLVEFCSARVLKDMCPNIGEKIGEGSFSRFTFNMMLAWEKPSSNDEEPYMVLPLLLTYASRYRSIFWNF